MKSRVLILSLLFTMEVLPAQVQTQPSIQDTAVVKKDSILVKKPVSRDTLRIADDFDRLVKTNGEQLIISIKSENAKEVSFIYPLNTVVNFIPLAQVKEIKYKDGTSKVVDLASETNLKVVKITGNPEDDWKLVKITYEPSDVEGLPELGPIDAKAEAKKMNTSTEVLERNAIIYLKKRAARMGAQKVLVTSNEIVSEYGELPSVTIKGVAYGRGTATNP